MASGRRFSFKKKEKKSTNEPLIYSALTWLLIFSLRCTLTRLIIKEDCPTRANKLGRESMVNQEFRSATMTIVGRDNGVWCKLKFDFLSILHLPGR